MTKTKTKTKTKAADSIPAPTHLSERSHKLWAQIVPRRGRSPERLTLLQAGLEALDRVEVCREQIAAEGMVSTTASSGVPHVHPLLKVEKEAQQIFLRAWSELDLDFDNAIDTDPDEFGAMPFGLASLKR